MSSTIDATAFTEFERIGWDRIPDGYHRFMGPITARAADPLLDATGIGGGERVLDLATGPGYIAGRAAARGAAVVGVDLSAQIIGLARRLNPGVEFSVADAVDLPFPAASFDAVVAGFLVPHLADHQTALAEVCRVLAPGGTAGLTTWGRPDQVPVLGLMVEAVELSGARPPDAVPSGPPFFKYSDEGALRGLLQGAGLVDVIVTTHQFVHRVSSPDTLWNGVLSGSVRTAALIAEQPSDVRTAIRAAFDRLAVPYHVDGALELPVSVLIATGRR